MSDYANLEFKLLGGGFEFVYDESKSSNKLWVFGCSVEVGGQGVHCTLETDNAPVTFHLTPDRGDWGRLHLRYRDGRYQDTGGSESNMPSRERDAALAWMEEAAGDLDRLAAAFYDAVIASIGRRADHEGVDHGDTGNTGAVVEVAAGYYENEGGWQWWDGSQWVGAVTYGERPQ